MTKEDIYKNYLKDPLLFEKRLLTTQKAENMKFSDSTSIKLLEILKIAISGSVDQGGTTATIRKINNYLNTDRT